jgi:sphingomyelin phosphodiesterase acid-like 3
MRSHAAGVKFVAVSGDLISHSFQCKFNALLPQSTPDSRETFAEKTLAYVMDELYGAFPGVPVYVALGNNDSGCGDYRLDANSEFLADAGKQVTKGFPASERASAEESFEAGGYYSVSLPAPIKKGRLLVLNDIFMSSNYRTCAGKPDPAASGPQLAWLARQLADARAARQKVWVMGHIPPGVDLYGSAKKLGNLCAGQDPTMFLSSEKLADMLAAYGDVIELAIFAHTHMDELRLLKDATQPPASQKGVPIKLVSSISPIHDNHPSFTLAQIDPSTAALVDYRVYSSSNLTGDKATWSELYDFAQSYHEAAFFSSSVNHLIAAFAADPDAKTQVSRNYIGDFSASNPSPVLQMFWPQYVCTLSNDTAQAFRACVCSTAR